VHAIESGKFAPSLVLAFKIATLFGVDINEVFAPDAEETLPPLVEQPASGRRLVFFGRSAGGTAPA
jgi:hypothetical protein